MYLVDDMLAIFCGLTVFLTLQKLSITIQLIFGECSPKKARFRTRIGEFGCAIFVCTYITTTIIAPIPIMKNFVTKVI